VLHIDDYTELRRARRTTTKISYTAPRALAARYRVSDDLTERLAGMDALTDAVIKAQNR
jgi:hypothetical protein